MAKRPLFLALAAVAGLCSGAVSAQQLEEVVVTAQKRAQSQQDVPIAITAVSMEDMERLGATEVKDIQYSTPNLVIAGTNPVQQSFGIRGISDRGRNPGYDQRIGVYVDGVWVGKSAASNQSALDVQTMEILRGPQGTLFGKNTVAGAINITTVKPSDEFYGYVQGEIGNYDLIRVKGSFNAPLSDTIKARLTVSSDQRDGYVDNVADGVGSDEYNDKDELALRGQLLWDVGDNTELLFSIDHLENDFVDVLGGVDKNDPVAPDPFEVNINGVQEAAVDGVGGVSLHINHVMDNGFELTSITAYRYEDWFFSDNDEDYTPLTIANSGIAADSDHFTQELRLASPAGERLDYVLGLYYLDQNIQGDGDATLDMTLLTGGAVPLPAYFINYEADVDVMSWAAFVHANYQLTDNLQLTAGLRYTYEEKEIDYIMSDPFTIFFANGSFADDRDGDDLSPMASLNWFINDDVMLYARYARAFKSGGYNADFIADLDGLEFDDEQVDAYELGLKSTWLDGRLRLNMAVFESDHSDFQVQAQTPVAGGGSVLTISNAGELTSRGFEADLQWLATDWLRVWGAYGYTDAEFDEFKGCVVDGEVGDCAGNRPPEAPESNYSLGAELTFPLAGGEAYASANYFWRDEMYSNPSNEVGFLNEEYSELGGRLGWSSGSGAFDVFLWGKNLTDEETQVYNSVSFLGTERAIYNAPRMYGVGMRWNFGDF
jgi:iron complex outermembrane receptor protein